MARFNVPTTIIHTSRGVIELEADNKKEAKKLAKYLADNYKFDCDVNRVVEINLDDIEEVHHKQSISKKTKI